jgi:methylisocitrate lyase
MYSDTRKKLKNQLLTDGIIKAPGVYDSLTAVIAEKAGFNALYLTGAGVSYSTLGAPDLGFITESEMVSKASYICEAINIPVIADGDTGYGNALNVRRTVKDYEKAGVTAIQLEDQQFPKKCGHLSNKTIVPAKEMVGKIKAAADARMDENFLIIARTDARETDGLGEAIERVNLYADAGADILFVEAPRAIDEMIQITNSINKPTIANMVEGGKTPFLPADELEEIGFKMVIYPNSVTRMVAKSAEILYREIKRKGTTKDLSEDMLQFNQLNHLLNIHYYKELESKYSGS